MLTNMLGPSLLPLWSIFVQDNSTTPLTSSFGSSTVQLMVGSTYEQYVIANLTTLDPSTTSKYQASVDATAGGNSTDYFIRIRSTVDDSLEAFSHKFQLASMTGSFTDEESSAISVGLASTTTSSSSSASAKSTTKTSTSSSKAKAVATSLTSSVTTSESATATKANKAAETTLPASSGAQRVASVALSAGAAVVVAAAFLG